MIETPSAALRQSSRERRSPVISSIFLPGSNRLRALSRRPSLLDGRTKHRILGKPYSRSFSTTFEPIKPLDPVTKIRSAAKAIYSELISLADFSLRFWQILLHRGNLESFVGGYCSPAFQMAPPPESL